jgi:hypothetical protein
MIPGLNHTTSDHQKPALTVPTVNVESVVVALKIPVTPKAQKAEPIRTIRK